MRKLSIALAAAAAVVIAAPASARDAGSALGPFQMAQVDVTVGGGHGRVEPHRRVQQHGRVEQRRRMERHGRTKKVIVRERRGPRHGDVVVKRPPHRVEKKVTIGH